MKRIERYAGDGSRRDEAGTNVRSYEPVRGAIAHVKRSVLTEYANLAGEHTRILRLALNEAEALAWQTDHPHLFFPALAAEKAQAALVWHRRQRKLRSGGGSELAFAE
jgi:hypothetical protein